METGNGMSNNLENFLKKNENLSLRKSLCYDALGRVLIIVLQQDSAFSSDKNILFLDYSKEVYEIICNLKLLHN
jgi:hypothetical protein